MSYRILLVWLVGICYTKSDRIFKDSKRKAKMRSNIALFIFGLAVSSLAACASLNPKNDDFSVELSRGSCFGNCPSYVLSIDRAGNVVYRGTRENQYDYGYGVGSITIEQVSELRREVAQTKFFDIPTPSCDEINDDESDFWLAVNDGEHERRVYRHHGCSYPQPDSVIELAKYIDEITNSARWHKSSN